MGIFAPFSYLEQRAAFVPAPPPWDPSQFDNIQYWWRADTNVTTATGGVSNWTDQINSFSIQQGTSGNRPSLTTESTLNNQDVIAFNGSSDFLFSTSTPAALSNRDFTSLCVYSFASSTPGNGIVWGVPYLLGAGNGRWWLDGLNGNQRIFDEGLSGTGGTNIESPATSGAHTLKVRYDASAGDVFYALDTLTETTKGTSGNTNQSWPASSTVAAGASVQSTSGGVFLSRYITVDIAEIVFIYGTPSSDEMDEWETYVNDRYGTIIT